MMQRNSMPNHISAMEYSTPPNALPMSASDSSSSSAVCSSICHRSTELPCQYLPSGEG